MQAGRTRLLTGLPWRAGQVMVGSAYFGHALLVELLLPALRASAPARIVWMSGALEAQAKLDWDDLGCARARASGQFWRFCVPTRSLLIMAPGAPHMLRRQESHSLRSVPR